nr:transglutaminase family protein [Thiorhodococcus mannitoliphagus]
MRFSAPAREHHIQIRLAPWHDQTQSVIRMGLKVDPEVHAAAAYDGFGNLFHHFAILAAHDELRFKIEAEVETRCANPFDFALIPSERELAWITERLHQAPRLWDLILHRSLMTPALPGEIDGHPVPRLQEGQQLIDQVQALMRWTRDLIAYEPAKAERAAELASALDAGAGSAEDLAHLLIAVTRQWQIPARFVSGYLDAAYFESGTCEDGDPPPQQLHHWAEVLIPGTGWIGFDPALGLLADATYVRVAVGRDAQDTQPIKQSCRSEGMAAEVDERLSVSRLGAS